MSQRGGANWLGWTLQFVAGALAGLFFGFIAISRRRSGWWLDTDVVPCFLLGAALAGAALGSHYGDQLWVDYRVIPPDAPAQSRWSKLLSLAAGLWGAYLMASALLKTLR